MENRVEILVDELTGALIGLARACGNGVKTSDTDKVFLTGLALTGDNVLNEKVINHMIKRVRQEKFAVVPNCRYCQSPCGNTNDYDMVSLKDEPENIRTIKEKILKEIRKRATALVESDKNTWHNSHCEKIYEALCKISYSLPFEKLHILLNEISL